MKFVVKWSKGRDCWIIQWHESGRRRLKCFESKAKANAEVDRMRSEYKEAGDAWCGLPGPERHALMKAYADARQTGLNIRQLLKEAGANPSRVESPSLRKVIDELLLVKERAGRADDYLDSLRVLLNQFSAGIGLLPIAQVGLPHVEKWIDSKNIASRATLRARLATLFNFAVRRGYRADNPCDRLELVLPPRKAPTIFTVEQAKACLEWLPIHWPDALPWFLLTTFAGLRPEEATQTTQENIHEQEGWIAIEAQTSKVRQRRVVYPMPGVVPALTRALDRGGELPFSDRKKRRLLAGYRLRPALRDVLKWETWPKDVTRHSAASYWLAVSNPVDVAKALGHSVQVLERNYKALVTRQQADQFWKLLTP